MTISLLLLDGTSANINPAGITAFAAMTDAECAIYGVSRGTKLTVSGTDIFTPLSIQEFLTQFYADLTQTLFLAAQAATATENANAFTAVPGLGLTCAFADSYLVTAGGALSTSIAATGSIELRLTKNGVPFGPTMVMGPGCFIANGALERVATITQLVALAVGDIVRLEFRRGAGAGIASITDPTLSASRTP